MFVLVSPWDGATEGRDSALTRTRLRNSVDRVFGYEPIWREFESLRGFKVGELVDWWRYLELRNLEWQVTHEPAVN